MLKVPKSPSTKDEVTEYIEFCECWCLPDEFSLSTFWKQNENKWPRLAKYVAQSWLATPASAAPCERVFSAAGQILTPRRNRLSAANVEMSVLSHANRDLLYDTEKTFNAAEPTTIDELIGKIP